MQISYLIQSESSILSRLEIKLNSRPNDYTATWFQFTQFIYQAVLCGTSFRSSSTTTIVL